MPKSLYQEIATVDIQIVDAGRSLRLDLETNVWEAKLRILETLIREYFSLRELCSTTPEKVAGFNVQPNEHDIAFYCRAIAKQVVSEVRSPGSDEEKIVLTAAILRQNLTLAHPRSAHASSPKPSPTAEESAKP